MDTCPHQLLPRSHLVGTYWEGSFLFQQQHPTCLGWMWLS